MVECQAEHPKHLLYVCALFQKDLLPRRTSGIDRRLDPSHHPLAFLRDCSPRRRIGPQIRQHESDLLLPFLPQLSIDLTLDDGNRSTSAGAEINVRVRSDVVAEDP